MSTLKKELTVGGLTMIAIGSCIGSGIFTTPSKIIGDLGNYSLVLLLWSIGGFITLLGTLVFSELSSRFPTAGGVYVYLKEAYGDLAGFLYGWVILLVINTGALAALSVALVDYLGFFFEFSEMAKKITAISLILGLTLINIFGVNISQAFAKLFTGAKLLAIAFIIIVVAISTGSWEIQEFSSSRPLSTDKSIISLMLISLVGVFWSFGGWHHATYLSGEAKRPRYTVPRAMILGSIIVTIVYLLCNIAYMKALPYELLSNTDKVAGDALNQVFTFGAKLVTIFIAISIFGTIGIYSMTAPRIYFQMAKDGIFFKALSTIHPTYRTPHIAMVVQALWACLLILIWGTFAKLITFVTFMDILFMCIAGFSIFIFRKRSTELPSFVTPLYPLVPLLYGLVTLAFVCSTLIQLPIESLAGLVIMIMGIVVFYMIKKKSALPK